MWVLLSCQAMCHREMSLEMLIFIGRGILRKNYSRDNWVWMSVAVKREEGWGFSFEGQEHIDDSEKPRRWMKFSRDRSGKDREPTLVHKGRVSFKGKEGSEKKQGNQVYRSPKSRSMAVSRDKSQVCQMLQGPNKKNITFVKTIGMTLMPLSLLSYVVIGKHF